MNLDYLEVFILCEYVHWIQLWVDNSSNKWLFRQLIGAHVFLFAYDKPYQQLFFCSFASSRICLTIRRHACHFPFLNFLIAQLTFVILRQYTVQSILKTLHSLHSSEICESSQYVITDSYHCAQMPFCIIIALEKKVS